jgi:hypothetical protein
VAAPRFTLAETGLELLDRERPEAELAREAARDLGLGDELDMDEADPGPELALPAGASGEARLALALLAGAVREVLWARRPCDAEAAWSFLEGPVAELCCDLAGFDAEAVRSRLRALVARGARPRRW